MACRSSWKMRRRKLQVRFAGVIRPVVRICHMQRMVKFIGLFWQPKTCSTQARTDERFALPRRICSGAGLPLDFLRWMWNVKPLALSQVSFFAERYPVSARTLFELFVPSRADVSSCPSYRAAFVPVSPRAKRHFRSMEMWFPYPECGTEISTRPASSLPSLVLKAFEYLTVQRASVGT